MTRNHLCCSAPVFLMLLGPWGALTAPCQRGERCVCLHCPAGQEPSMACSEVEGADAAVACRDCPPGTFSDGHDPEPCRAHAACVTLNRQVSEAGTSHSDAECGACLPGFHSETTQNSSTPHACARSPTDHGIASVDKSATHGSGVGVTNATSVRSTEEKTAEYAVYALAPVFCMMGLLGILICNLLKKKGYCTAEKEVVHDIVSEKDGNPCHYIEENTDEDTISALVRLIAEKTENAAALEEMLLEYELTQTDTDISKSPLLSPVPRTFQSLPRLCVHQHHLHTINGQVPHSGLCCSRCSQKKWPKLLLPPAPVFNDAHKTPHSPAKPPTPIEGTVLSVGRFQVAQIQEGKPLAMSTTPAECRNKDSGEPAEVMSFLGMTSLSKAPSPHAADRT